MLNTSSFPCAQSYFYDFCEVPEASFSAAESCQKKSRARADTARKHAILYAAFARCADAMTHLIDAARRAGLSARAAAVEGAPSNTGVDGRISYFLTAAISFALAAGEEPPHDA